MPASPSKRALKEFFATLGVTQALADDASLAKWANGYVKAAASAGPSSPRYRVGMGPTVAGTIKLICDLRPYFNSAAWLSWQRYGAPRGRGPWWIAEFQFPPKWIGATMNLRAPGNFAYEALLAASDQACAQLELRPAGRAAFPPAAIRRLARVILVGMRCEWDDTEFGLICKEGPRSLAVDIWHGYAMNDALELNRDMKPRKDADGIYWFTGRPKRFDKDQAAARSARADRFSWQDDDIQFVSDNPPKLASRSVRKKA